MQATAIAQVAEETGVQSVTIVYVDDAYGRPFAEAVSAELASVVDRRRRERRLRERRRRSRRRGRQPCSTRTPSVVILLASSNDGTRFLEALSESSSSADSRR